VAFVAPMAPRCAHPHRCPGGQPGCGGSKTVAMSVTSNVSTGGASLTACASCVAVPILNEADASPAHAGDTAKPAMPDKQASKTARRPDTPVMTLFMRGSSRNPGSTPEYRSNGVCCSSFVEQIFSDIRATAVRALPQKRRRLCGEVNTRVKR